MKLELDKVVKIFRLNGKPWPALGPLTLDIPQGAFVALVGPSGCGKSTLLRLVADLLSPTEGTIRLDGQPPRQMRRQKAIAWMDQHPALLPWATVAENVALPWRVNARGQRPWTSVEALLALVGLADYARAYPYQLSGGQQQRVVLARTLAVGARLWLMDEPFASLDELTREALADEVGRLWQQFRPTVLWVTHSIPEAVRLADRVLVLSPRPGRLLADIAVPLPRPREDTDGEVVAFVRQVRNILRRAG